MLARFVLGTVTAGALIAPALAGMMTAEDVAVAAPEAEGELAVGFFGSRYERATPAEREYMRAMAALSTEDSEAVPTAEVTPERVARDDRGAIADRSLNDERPPASRRRRPSPRIRRR